MAQDNASVIKSAADAFNAGHGEALGKVFGGALEKDSSESLQTLRGAFPDLRYQVDHVQTDGQTVTFAYTVSGTHKGQLGPFAATNKAATWHGSGVATVENGKIVSVHTQEDWVRAALQLGIHVASLTGTWAGTLGKDTVTLKLVQTGTDATGTATLPGFPPFAVRGTNLYPNVSLHGTAFELPVTFEGEFKDANTIPGTFTVKGFPPEKVTLKRQ